MMSTLWLEGRLSTKCRSTVKEPSNEGSGEALQTSFVYRPWKITSDVRSLLEWYSCGMGWDAAGKEGRRRISPRSSGWKIYSLSVRLPVTEGGREGRSLLWTGRTRTAVPMQQMPAILHVFSDF